MLLSLLQEKLAHENSSSALGTGCFSIACRTHCLGRADLCGAGKKITTAFPETNLTSYFFQLMYYGR